MLLSNYYDNLPETEKTIIDQRLKWFTNLDSTGLTLRELGEKYVLTNERLRQIESVIISEFEYFIKFHSELLYNYFNNNLLNNKDII
jgi:DNA-directed RNA polymerase sigma subunit (sigma70/sigma32)